MARNQARNQADEGVTVRLPKDLHTAVRDFAKAQLPPWPIAYALGYLLRAGMSAKRLRIVGAVGADGPRRSEPVTSETES